VTNWGGENVRGNSGNWRARVGGVLLSAGLLAAALGGCSSSSSATTGAAVAGGTATFAHVVGDDFNWILPLITPTHYSPYEQDVWMELWRPLYYPGEGAVPGIDYSRSLAYPPVWSSSGTVVTIRLRTDYRWSDGIPVTTKDVQFFMELYSANKGRLATYIPGDFPDNVSRVVYNSPTTFTLYLRSRYSQQWFDDNQLTQIVPLPAQAWDRTSLGGPVTDAAATPAGARRVFSFLVSQAQDLSTYASNPLWKVVDGPWRLTSMNPVTYQVELSRNPAYTGPFPPHLDHVVFETPTSATAEVDLLRAGELDYGYLPYSDLGLVPSLEREGYIIAPWAPEYVQWAEINYSGPYAPLTRQLYIRQALQHLVDEPLYLRTTMHGYGQLTYGPVPNLPGSPFVSPEEKVDPYPYSPAAARRLLLAHGWRPGPGGVMVCTRPGDGPGQCGAGIARGRTLSLLFLFQAGYQGLAAQAQAFQTAARSAGIDVSLDELSQSQLESVANVCPFSTPCDWALALYALWYWNYGEPDIYPTGGQIFGKGNYEGGGYYSPEAQRLIDETHTRSGLGVLYAYEDYLSRQVAALWFPTWDNRISVIKDTLKGAVPQSVFGYTDPSRWYFVRS
jgi:peptide/nickel transport system substrate-binding protein